MTKLERKLKAAQARVERQQAKLDEALRERGEVVLELIRDGHREREVADLIGLSPGRLHQVKVKAEAEAKAA